LTYVELEIFLICLKCSGSRPFYTLKLEEEYKQIVDEIYIYQLKKYAIMSNN